MSSRRHDNGHHNNHHSSNHCDHDDPRHHHGHHNGPRFVFGTNGDDTLYATDHSELVFGFRGNDKINAGGGNDTVYGNRGDDFIDGGTGNDKLFGDRGNDALIGGDGKDDLEGGDGRDLMIGGAGNDELDGGRGNDVFMFRHGSGVDRIEHLEKGDRIDVRDFHFASSQAVINAAQQVGHDVVINLGAGDKIILESMHLADLHPEQFVVAGETKGPSSSQTPYLVSTNDKVETTSLLTVGDSVGGYKMVGIPDGLGAFDNGDGTFTLLMNHELSAGQGTVRAHGANGAFVSEWVIDKTTLQVLSGHDLMHDVWMYDSATHTYVDHTAASSPVQFSRFCSADLADPTAFYNPATGLGYNGGRLFLNGEETGAEGRAMAHIASGPGAGNSYELASLGNMAFENVVANAHTGNKTVVAETDDGQNGQVYFYFGDKQAAGNAVERAGLVGGSLYGLKVTELGNATDNNNESNGTNLGGDFKSAFTLVNLGDVSGKTGAQIDADSETAGVTSFLRPEDGAWDTVNHNRFYFVTTNAFNAPSRLWAVDFNDASNPNAGGTITMLLDGTEGQKMLDNLTVSPDGKITLQEDPGNNAHIAKLWQYDPATDQLTQLAQHDPSRFDPASASPLLTQDEESSGVIDVTHILGNAGENAYLAVTQAHYGIPGELVEGGQLMLITQYHA